MGIKKKLRFGIWGMFLLVMMFIIPSVKAQVNFTAGTVINTSVSNSSLTFNTYNVSVDQLIVDTHNVTMNNVTCSNGAFVTQVFHNVPNQNNDSSTYCITTDTTNPSVTSLTETPSDPATYSQGARYQFNATITDNVGIGTVLLEFNGVNYTPSNLGSVYNVSIYDLGVGSYSYRWFANDTSGNVNNTQTGTYTVNKANGVVFTYIDHSRASKSIFLGTNNTYLNGTLSVGLGNINLYVNNTLWNTGTSPIFNVSNFSLGTYQINVTYAGNQNFTYDDEVWILTVTDPVNVSRILYILPDTEDVPYIKKNKRFIFR